MDRRTAALGACAPVGLKVAHVATVDATVRYLLLSQLCWLSDVGYRVYAISADGPDVPAVVATGIPHIAVPFTRRPDPWTDVLALASLVQVMRRGRFTIVHTHTPKADVLGQLAASIARVPIVVRTLHGYHFHEHMAPLPYWLYVTLERFCAPLADVILSQSKEDIDVATRLRLCPSQRLVHLGNGINLDTFDPRLFSSEAVRRKREELRIEEGRRVVGFVGRLAGRRKGFLDFVRAARQLLDRGQNVTFVIVGATDRARPDAEDPDIAREYGIWEHCRFLGQLPNSELPMLYSAMDVVVLPSLFEGVPRVLMEATAMEVPVVATDVKGNREVVQHGVNGLLVPLGDVHSLVDAIIELLANPDKARQMGIQGRRLALERFDERVVFRRIEQEYARLLDAKLGKFRLQLCP